MKSNDELKAIISSFKYGQEIIDAIAQDDKLRFYIEAAIKAPTNNPFYNDFQAQIKQVYINSYKVKRFNYYCKFPLSTVDMLETCFNELSRVWESRNKVANYEFTSINAQTDGISYLADIEKKLQSDLWKSYQTSISDIVVIDLPKAQNSQRPEPYPVFIKPSNIKAFKPDPLSEFNEFIWVMFTQRITTVTSKGEKETANYLYFYTNEFYSVYKEDQNNEYKVIVDDVPHGLGYCPAFRVTQNRLTNTSVFTGQNPVTSVLSKLFWHVFEGCEFINHKGKYLAPFLQAIEQSCGYKKKHDNVSVQCKNGYLVDTSTQNRRMQNKEVELCPSCGEKYSPGAGNKISVPKDLFNFGGDVKGKVDISMLKYITPEIAGTEFLGENLIEQKADIQQSISGKVEQASKMAINEKQVVSNYESPEQILIAISNDLSTTIRKINTTLLKLRYGSAFVKTDYHLGTEHFLRSEMELLEQETKTDNPNERSEVRRQRLETKYKNNPALLKRQKLLDLVLPLANVKDSDLMELFKSQQIDPVAFHIRANFDNLIAQFENKFGNIVAFKESFFYKNVSDLKKIDFIKNELKSILGPITEPLKKVENDTKNA